jgi:3-phenylpropionate/trans-cinnamate dioxygenase ferredoxin reductase subunit
VFAGMNVNVWDVNEHIQAPIRARHPIDRARPGVPLEELLAAESRSHLDG